MGNSYPADCIQVMRLYKISMKYYVNITRANPVLCQHPQRLTANQQTAREEALLADYKLHVFTHRTWSEHESSTNVEKKQIDARFQEKILGVSCVCHVHFQKSVCAKRSQ